MTHDLVIRGGMVVDGTGGPWFAGDVAVDEGMITKVGRVRQAGRQEIDAVSLIVAPGFVNIHSHLDFQVFKQPLYETAVKQGITTELMGQCGVSAAPMLGDFDAIMKYMTYFWYGLEPSPWDWRSMAEFLEAVEAGGVALNLAMLVGHKNLRLGVMGDACRPATPDEVVSMQRLLEKSLEEGAFGLSLGMQWAPSWFAEAQEYVDLAESVRRSGGMLATHMRSEGDKLIESVQEIVNIAARSGVRAQISHLKAAGQRNWGKTNRCLEILEMVRCQGVDIACDTQPYTAEHMALRGCIPPWFLAEFGMQAFPKALQDPQVREAIADDMVHRRSRHWDTSIVDGLFEAAGHDNVVLARTDFASDKQYVQKSLKDIGRLLGTNAYEALFHLISNEENAPPCGALYFMLDEQEVQRVLAHRLTVPCVDVSPRMPHPRFTGAFPRLLGRYVRDNRIIGLEEAVRKLTSLPAQRIGIEDRGELRRGMAADITVFDLKTIGDMSTYEQPHQDPTGIKYVCVNGKIVVDNGRHTGSLPGRVLRSA